MHPRCQSISLAVVSYSMYTSYPTQHTSRPAVLILQFHVTPAKCMRPSPPRLVFCVQSGLRASRFLALSCDHFYVLGKPVCVSACLTNLVALGDSQVCRLKCCLCQRTFVLLQPSLNAASCANSSPNPSINPFTNGRSRLIAAPRNKLHSVGGWYKIMGLEESDRGSSEESFEFEWFAS